MVLLLECREDGEWFFLGGMEVYIAFECSLFDDTTWLSYTPSHHEICS